MTFLAAFESRFPVGSSAKTIDGLFIKALAIAVLWACHHPGYDWLQSLLQL